MQAAFPMQAPFPWFGSKSRCASLVWPRFGDVANYVEPFFGSGAMLLGRPAEHEARIETINDLDGYVANFWRAMKHAPDDVAKYACDPPNENELHARHVWLVARKDKLRAKLEGDPEWFSPKVAGWWVWGQCCWIGSGWCSGRGPWWPNENGELVKGDAGQGVKRQLPHLGNAGQGVTRQQINLQEWFGALSTRLARVRVCSGDWTRVLGPTPTYKLGVTGVFLDPPYANTANRDPNLYAQDSLQVAHKVREWAIEAGSNPKMRIALCGYEGEHAMPGNWDCVAWKARGGYGGQKQDGENVNAARERIWFSPACLKPAT